MIVNSTRYATEDIENIVKALWTGKQCQDWVLKVKYASSLPDKPYSGAASGPYVKFARNGDEGSHEKVLVLTPPNAFKCDPLVALAAADARKVPDDMLYEVCRRIELICDYHQGKRGHVCTEYRAYVWTDNARKRYADAGLIQLRYVDEKCSQESLRAQKERVTAQRNFLLKVQEFNHEVSQCLEYRGHAERNRINAKREMEWAERNEQYALQAEEKASKELAEQVKTALAELEKTMEAENLTRKGDENA